MSRQLYVFERTEQQADLNQLEIAPKMRQYEYLERATARLSDVQQTSVCFGKDSAPTPELLADFAIEGFCKFSSRIPG